MHPWTPNLIPETDDPALADYLDACEDYFLRQLIVYENWPQRSWGPVGYTGKKVFVDQNA